MKKLFILTGEPSGDKLASHVILKLREKNKNIQYLSVGGSHLNALGIKSIYDLKEITYIAFTDVLFNLFKIKKKIDETVKKILEFKPDILFTVDSPDFTLRVAQRVKKSNPNIKIIHFIAPKVWAWREGRVKKMKKYLDHILLLFNFEKKYFDKENILSTFVGHPLLDDNVKNVVKLNNLINNKKRYISLFAGSRESEIKIHAPILFEFIKKMNNKEDDFNFVFHSTDKYKNYFYGSLIGLAPQLFIGVSLGAGVNKLIDDNENMPSFLQMISSPDIYLPILGLIVIFIIAFFSRKIFFKSN